MLSWESTGSEAQIRQSSISLMGLSVENNGLRNCAALRELAIGEVLNEAALMACTGGYRLSDLALHELCKIAYPTCRLCNFA